MQHTKVSRLNTNYGLFIYTKDGVIETQLDLL